MNDMFAGSLITPNPLVTLREDQMIEPHIVIPLIGGKQVTMYSRFPISEEQWDALMLCLQVMKPGLVEEPDADAEFKDAATRPPYEAPVESSPSS